AGQRVPGDALARPLHRLPGLRLADPRGFCHAVCSGTPPVDLADSRPVRIAGTHGAFQQPQAAGRGPRIRPAPGSALGRETMNTATTTTRTIVLHEGFFSQRNWFDWLFAAVVLAGGLYAFAQYHQYMD